MLCRQAAQHDHPLLMCMICRTILSHITILLSQTESYKLCMSAQTAPLVAGNHNILAFWPFLSQKNSRNVQVCAGDCLALLGGRQSGRSLADTFHEDLHRSSFTKTGGDQTVMALVQERISCNKRYGPIRSGVACAILPTSSELCIIFFILAARGFRDFAVDFDARVSSVILAVL